MAAKNVEKQSSQKINNCISSKAIELLHSSKRGADVHFTFESSVERIPAHKNILAVSPVFEKEFFGLMPEKEEVKIIDASADAFKEFLQFFYLNQVELSMQHIQGVMHLSKKYQIDECLEICSIFLKKNLTINEMCMGYQLALHYDQNDLKKFCRREICVNTRKVLISEGFLNCDWIVLNEIVKSVNFLCREADLLEACINWARNACKRNKLNVNKENVRNQLKDVIYEIRFNQITFQEFTKFLINPQNPYDYDEVKVIMRIIANHNIGSTKFNCSNRFGSITWNSLERIKCERLIISKTLTEYNIPDLVSATFS